MVNGLIKLEERLKVKNITHLHLMPLWYNSNLNFEYRMSWEKRGYHIVSDTLNENRELFSKKELHKRDLKINFLDYFRIKQNIEGFHKTIDKKPPKRGPHIPRLMFEIGLNQQGCSRIYNKIMNYGRAF